MCQFESFTGNGKMENNPLKHKNLPQTGVGLFVRQPFLPFPVKVPKPSFC
jgi:hypothetical protein